MSGRSCCWTRALLVPGTPSLLSPGGQPGKAISFALSPALTCTERWCTAVADMRTHVLVTQGQDLVLLSAGGAGAGGMTALGSVKKAAPAEPAPAAAPQPKLGAWGKGPAVRNSNCMS